MLTKILYPLLLAGASLSAEAATFESLSTRDTCTRLFGVATFSNTKCLGNGTPKVVGWNGNVAVNVCQQNQAAFSSAIGIQLGPSKDGCVLSAYSDTKCATKALSQTGSLLTASNCVTAASKSYKITCAK
ncbi:hypothetical protein NA57DRAFT_77172 [Rhizodiscina lignyota]|uniref:Uncharacterized protein n=1 Tax=Rhizodiscina lignyota TaxID=1504668 RepID=A0A9P4M5Z4_9PEZI|nr:hypothetical protein NA57DRAFT_77172 [Rhizodiscina lignyota]